MEGKMETKEEMGTKRKFKTSNLTVCLNAIKNYIDMDESTLKEKEKGQLKDRARRAVEHLSAFFSPTDENVFLDECPSKKLPTIE
jgi:hypothetical protein